MIQDDLWGELPDIEKTKTPLAILKEQSELLSDKTKGLLIGEIKQQQKGEQFIYIMIIIVPTLNNYSYQLLQVTHKIGFYPLRLQELRSKSTTCSSEEEFKQGLGDIFKSQETQNVISKLLTHVKFM